MQEPSRQVCVVLPTSSRTLVPALLAILLRVTANLSRCLVVGASPRIQLSVLEIAHACARLD